MSVAAVRQEADIIDQSCIEIERLLAVTPLDAEEWRIALGVIEAIRARVWKLRQAMLNEAMERNRRHRAEEPF